MDKDSSAPEDQACGGGAEGQGPPPSGFQMGPGVLNVSNQAVEASVRQFLGKAAEDKEDLQMYAVQPLSSCPHLGSVVPVPDAGLNVSDPCKECGHVGENWVCLICYEVHCGRYVNEHMVQHGTEQSHLLVLSYADLSAWCYACDNYIHNKVLLPAKRAAHISKFGEDIPGL